MELYGKYIKNGLRPEDCDYYFENAFKLKEFMNYDLPQEDLSNITIGLSPEVTELIDGSFGTEITHTPKALIAENLKDIHLLSDYNNKLKFISPDLFKFCPNLESATYSFNGSKTLEKVPEELFDNNKKLIRVNGCFKGCENIISKLPDVWNKDKFPKVTDGTNYADGCTKAANYSEIPADFGGPAQ